jgi:hypothetical protein
MYEIRCPSCRLRLWLYQGMGRHVPQECPGCHLSRATDSADTDAAARLSARIASDGRARARAASGENRPRSRGPRT